jgi:flavin reductase (DIM6/NTAB) family NADH-FMN oxidoreductase RutF
VTVTVVPPDVPASAEAHREAYLAAMSNTPSAVTVLAVGGESGPVAQTVSAISSVSADPPTLLACVNRRSPLCAAAAEVGYFSVNVLSAEQAQVSDSFAGRSSTPYDFRCATWGVGVTGAPLLHGAVATFECVLSEEIEAATHVILLGGVLRSAAHSGEPLVHHARSYGRIEKENNSDPHR